MWDIKEPTHYSKRAGHEVPSVMAVLCECMSGCREGDMPCMGLSVSHSHITLHFCANVVEKKKTFNPLYIEMENENIRIRSLWVVSDNGLPLCVMY